MAITTTDDTERVSAIDKAVSIIIPAYNEEAGIGEVIRHIKEVISKTQITCEVIVVDDGSSDQTLLMAQKAGARVLSHAKNQGYGAALKTGIRAATYEFIVIIDADSTYPVEPIPLMLKQLQTADMVVGSRTGQNVNVPLIRRPAKWILGKLAGYVTGQYIPDLNSGLRAFRRKCAMQYFSILSDKFSFTTTITVAMLSDDYLITYVPIDYYKRTGISKVAAWDFVNFTTLVLRLSMLFQPLKVFIPIAGIFMLLGGIKFLIDLAVAFQRVQQISFSLITQPVVSTTSVILLLSGLQILLIGMMSDGLARKISQRIPSQYESHSPNNIVNALNKNDTS